MNKLIIRLIAILLIPCLVLSSVEGVTAASLSNPLSHGERVRVRGGFAEQAITPSLTVPFRVAIQKAKTILVILAIKAVLATSPVLAQTTKPVDILVQHGFTSSHAEVIADREKYFLEHVDPINAEEKSRSLAQATYPGKAMNIARYMTGEVMLAIFISVFSFISLIAMIKYWKNESLKRQVGLISGWLLITVGFVTYFMFSYAGKWDLVSNKVLIRELENKNFEKEVAVHEAAHWIFQTGNEAYAYAFGYLFNIENGIVSHADQLDQKIGLRLAQTAYQLGKDTKNPQNAWTFLKLVTLGKTEEEAREMIQASLKKSEITTSPPLKTMLRSNRLWLGITFLTLIAVVSAIHSMGGIPIAGDALSSAAPVGAMAFGGKWLFYGWGKHSKHKTQPAAVQADQYDAEKSLFDHVELVGIKKYAPRVRALLKGLAGRIPEAHAKALQTIYLDDNPFGLDNDKDAHFAKGRTMTLLADSRKLDEAIVHELAHVVESNVEGVKSYWKNRVPFPPIYKMAFRISFWLTMGFPVLIIILARMPRTVKGYPEMLIGALVYVVVSMSSLRLAGGLINFFLYYADAPFVSHYAMVNDREDFAESYRFYVFYREEFRARAVKNLGLYQRYTAMQEIFGHSSDSEAPPPVHPPKNNLLRAA